MTRSTSLQSGCWTLSLIALLAIPASADSGPTFSSNMKYPPKYGKIGALTDDLSGTALHPQLHNQLVDALHAVSEETYVELQYGFDAAPETGSSLWVFRSPIWRDDESPIGNGSVVFSQTLMLDAEQAIPEPTFSRAFLPYIAAWPHMTLLLEQRAEGTGKLDGMVAMQGADLLGGWWIGQQPGATIEDCDAIANWRSDSVGSMFHPGPHIRLGFALRGESLDQVLGYLKPQNAQQSVPTRPTTLDAD